MIRILTKLYRIQNFVTIYQKVANRWRFDSESRFGNSRTIRDRFEDDSRSIRDLESERKMNMSSCFTWFWTSKTIRGCQIRGRFEVSYMIFIHTFISYLFMSIVKITTIWLRLTTNMMKVDKLVRNWEYAPPEQSIPPLSNTCDCRHKALKTHDSLPLVVFDEICITIWRTYSQILQSVCQLNENNGHTVNSLFTWYVPYFQATRIIA